MMDDGPSEQELAVRNLVLSVCDLKQNGEPPSERCLATGITVGTKLYLFGGCDQRQIHGDMYMLSIETMKWSEVPLMVNNPGNPSPRYGHSMAAVNEDVVIFGGMCGSSSTSGALLGDDTAGAGAGAGAAAQRSLATAPIFQSGFGHSASIEDQPTVYMFGGSSSSFTKMGSSGESGFARTHHAGAMAADSKYYVFGGVNAQGSILNDLIMFDVISQSWRTVSAGGGEAPSPRFAAKMVFLPKSNELLLFGGSVISDGGLYSFSLLTNSWSNVTGTFGGTPPIPRMYHSFDNIGSRIFAFAGKTNDVFTDLYILDTVNKQWSKPLYEGEINLRGHSTAVLHDKLIVFGGVRDKKDKREVVVEEKVNHKLFFLNVLEIKKDGVSDGDFKFKLVTVGDSGVGKSCLLTRFVTDYYNDFHVSTIGVDFKTVITMVKGKLVKLQLWDTAGQERFSVVTGNYYRNSDGFIFVYDATNRASFDHIEQWLEQVQQHHECGPSTMKILVGNKHDLKDRIVVTEAEARQKADKLGAIFMATSAKTAANVDMAFLTAATNLVEMRKAALAAAPKSSASAGAGGLVGLGSNRGGASASSSSAGNSCSCGAK